MRATKECAYDPCYHNKLQGFVYSLLMDTPYAQLHDKKEYKFFSFSNIFPPKDFKEDGIYSLLIASPDENMVKTFKASLVKLKENDALINIGDMQFYLSAISTLNPKVSKSCTFITGTPIIVRIPRENYAKYGIKPPKDYPYLYWRKEYPFNAFLKQLEENLFKKYNAFKGKIEEFPVFEQFVFKRTVSLPVAMDGKQVTHIASYWKFIFGYVGEGKRELLRFGLDAGFGELNSMGFGFMNIEK